MRKAIEDCGIKVVSIDQYGITTEFTCHGIIGKIQLMSVLMLPKFHCIRPLKAGVFSIVIDKV